MHAIGEQQSKRMQSGSSSRSGRDREQQLKRTQSGEHAAAAEAGAIGEQQLEADANGEQQLKWMQSGQGAAADSKLTQAVSSQRNQGASGRNRGAAALHRELSGARLLTVGERGGSS